MMKLVATIIYITKKCVIKRMMNKNEEDNYQNDVCTQI